MRWPLLVSLLIGCTPPQSAEPAQAEALARVNGQTITPAEVVSLVRTTGVAPREALGDLVRERLLLTHADKYERSAAVQRGVERALVQRLLAREVGEGDPAAQQAKLERLLARLTSETRVQYQDEAIQRAFAPEP